MPKPLPRLHYVSQGETPEDHLTNIESLVRAGCPWVQLRLKGVSDAVYRQAATRALEHCHRYGALLTINDRPDIAAAIGAHGAHVGLEDLDPTAARSHLPNGIIGATANALADIERAVRAGVDYIGLGPYRFTTTKRHLRPVLGLSGYSQLLAAMRARGWGTPVLAIGGIGADDVAPLMKTGVYGIAVSGLLTHDKTQVAALEQLIEDSLI